MGISKKIKERVKFWIWKIGLERKIKPPHLVKEKIILKYKKVYGIKSLIETGTYEGEMVDAMKKHFQSIFSIELNSVLADNAKKKFSDYRKIKIIQGDSSNELPKILSQLSTHALFWLDAHYSGGKTSKGAKETPILEEIINIIHHSKKSVILIDDADNFGKGDYPSFDALFKIIKSNFDMKIKDNIIRITPKNENK